MRRILPYLFLLLLTATSCVDNDTYDDNPQGNLEALWRILDEHYCFFEEKGVDWNAVHEKICREDERGDEREPAV